MRRKLKIFYLHYQGWIIVGGMFSILLLSPLAYFCLFPEIKVMESGCYCGRLVDSMVAENVFSGQTSPSFHSWVVTPGNPTHHHEYWDAQIVEDYRGNWFTVWYWNWKHDKSVW